MRGFSFLHHPLAGAACVCLVAPTSALAQDAEASKLPPSSNWHLDGSEDRCRLARSFGEGENKIAILIDQDEPSDTIDLTISGAAMKDIDWEKPIDLVFGDLEPITLEDFQDGSLEGYGPALLKNDINLGETNADEEERSTNKREDDRYAQAGLLGLETDRFESVQTFSLVQGDETLIGLQIPNFHSALKALDFCSETFVTHWGLDLEAQKTRLRGPVMTNFDIVVRRILKTYSRAALRAGEQGTIRFRVLVDAQGAVTDCQHSAATQVEALRPKICKELQWAKFDPAIGADGQPIPSYYAGKVRYAIP